MITSMDTHMKNKNKDSDNYNNNQNACCAGLEEISG